MELLFESDAVTRTVQTFHFDDVTEQVTIKDQQDVQGIVETTKRLQGLDRPKGDLRRAAVVPLNVLFELKKQWREQDLSWEERQKALAAWLNDPDNKVFRAEFKGRI